MEAGELNESEEVLDVVFPSGDESAEVVWSIRVTSTPRC
jgi:hypothetical protein